MAINKAVELGVGYLTVLPDMSKFTDALKRSMGGDMTRAGQNAGEDFGQGMAEGSKRAAKRGADDAARALASGPNKQQGDKAGGDFGDAYADAAVKEARQGAKRVASEVDKEVSKAGKKGGGILSGLAGGAKAGVAGLVAGIGIGVVADGFTTLTDSASDLAETVSKSDTIWGKNADAVRKWADGAADSIGMSKTAALEANASYGNLFQQIGINGEQSLKMSQDYMKASADLASFNNANVQDVNDALLSAQRGEYDSLQKFIPTINGAKVEQEALRLSKKKSAKELTDADKAMATHTLVMKGMGAAQGDFAKTSDGAANKQRILAARMENMKTKFGEALAPVKKFLLDGAEKFLNWIEEVSPKVQKFWKENLEPVFKQLGATLNNLWQNVIKPVMGLIWNIFKNVIGPLMLWWYSNIVLPMINGVVWAFKNVLAPIFMWLYNSVLQPAWENFIKPMFIAFGKFVTESVVPAFKSGVDLVGKIWQGLKDVIGEGLDFVINTIINDGLIDSLNWLLDKFGISKIPRISYNYTASWEEYKGPRAKSGATKKINDRAYAFGGAVEGYAPHKRADNVVARLTPGEFVHDVDAVNYYGLPFMQALLGRRIPREMLGYAFGGVVAPVAGRSSGWNGGYYAGSGRWHGGIDYPVRTGTPVMAFEDGVVVRAGWDAGGFGNHVRVRHPNGLLSIYGHLSRVLARIGQTVTDGSIIGRSGSTGRSTGPHLHFEIRGPGGSGPYSSLNPLAFLGGIGNGVGSAIAGLTSGIGETVGVNNADLAKVGSAIKAKAGTAKSNWFMDSFGSIGSWIWGKAQEWAKNLLPWGGGGNEVTPYLRDNGGYLPPGLSLVNNKTGDSELVLNKAQQDRLFGRSAPLIEKAEFHNSNAREVVDELDWMIKVQNYGGAYA